MKLFDLINLLKTSESVQRIDEQRDTIAELIPEVSTMFDFDQKNRAHQYDLWMHSLHTVCGLPKNLSDSMIYLAALLHDIGKTQTQVEGQRPDDKNMHYPNHQMKSFDIVREQVIPGLLKKQEILSDKEQERLLFYVRHHDDRIHIERTILKEQMKEVSFEMFYHLMYLQISDAKAHIQIPIIAQKIITCQRLLEMYDENTYANMKQAK